MRYFLQKAPLAAVTLLLVASICFLLTKLAGEEAAFGERNPPPEVRAEIERKWGLDRPLHEQYFLHLRKLLVFDSMESRQQRNKTLRDVLRENLPASLRLGIRAVLLAVVLGVPIGVLCAVHHNRLADGGGKVVALVGVSVPNFVLASFAIYFLARRWELLPALGWDASTPPFRLSDGWPGVVRGAWEEVFRLRLWIPAACLGAFPFAAILRLTRSSMLEALRQDYVRTARAKGLTPWKVVARHALRNALTPVVTYTGPVTAGVLTGSLVVETIFAMPGVGRFFVESINNRDLPLIMGLTVFYSAVLVFMNLLVDAVYPILNPKLRDIQT